jgi:hypothetical protein
VPPMSVMTPPRQHRSSSTVCASMSGIAILFCAASLAATGSVQTIEASARRVQSPAAQSIGTATNLQEAARTLVADFATVATRSLRRGSSQASISVEDLRRVVETSDSSIPDGLRDAARFFLASPISRQLAGGDERKREPGDGVTLAGLHEVIKIASSGQLGQTLIELAEKAGRGFGSENRFYAILLRDPGISAQVHDQLAGSLSDARLLDVVGHPITQGNTRDTADETGAFLGLARTSWLGTAEAEALAHFKVPFSMDRGSQDHDVSYWNGQSMHLSEKMITGGKPGYAWELLAHEGGHAIFQLSGLQKRTFRDLENAGLTAHIGDIVNEAFAGAFGNRAHIALFGMGDKNIDRHLLLANDLGDSLVSDTTFYAKRYHVDTAAARAGIPEIRQVMANDLLPYLQQDFGLLGDPQLALQLPPPR